VFELDFLIYEIIDYKFSHTICTPLKQAFKHYEHFSNLSLSWDHSKSNPQTSNQFTMDTKSSHFSLFEKPFHSYITTGKKRLLKILFHA